jgi:hypothetical protein
MSPIISQALGWLFIGMCAMMAFMGPIFAGGGYANKDNASKTIITFFDLSIWLLPLVCIVFGVLMSYGYLHSWTFVYKWLFVPPILVALWFVVAFKIAG